ncbi:MAG: (2Fe-2S)-binding protein [Saccharolobus sp.]|uniref:(2Fe-2S)-binding protein n=1 Tax=Saccharolobus sp. TaxID=2100761 RepID=UPI0031777850
MKIKFIVNGEEKILDVKPNELLIHVLREKLGLTGTKEGCGTGECGACIVLVNGKAVNSCLTLAVEVDGANILTIEGLKKNGELHPLQQAFIEEHAVQCGYCTPGMIIAALSYLSEKPSPTEEEIKEAISGNLCRCGSYPFIIKAIKKASETLRGVKK